VGDLLKVYGQNSEERKAKKTAINKIFPTKTFGIKNWNK